MEFLPEMHRYFRGEVFESYLILALCAALVLFAAILLVWFREPFTMGVAGMLVVSALVGVSVGGTIVWRTGDQVVALEKQYREDRVTFVREEGARMDVVMKNFVIYRYMYLGAMVLAAVFFMLTSSAMLHGIGVGLLVFAAMGFTIDFYAEARGEWYLERIRAEEAT